MLSYQLVQEIISRSPPPLLDPELGRLSWKVTGRICNSAMNRGNFKYVLVGSFEVNMSVPVSVLNFDQMNLPGMSSRE